MWRWRTELHLAMSLPLLVLTAGCPAPAGQGGKPAAIQPEQALAGGAPAAPPAPAEASPNERETVRYIGRLDMDRLAGGKRFQGTELLLDDGRRLLLSYRPVKKWFKYVDRRVAVQGQHYTNPPDVQQVMADHFRVTALELAAGETPHGGEVGRLPTPDMVRSRAEFEAHDGRWVQLFATLKTGSKHEKDDWCDVVALLDDGAEVWTSMYKSSFAERWQPLLGKPVSLIGKAHLDSQDSEQPLKLHGQVAVCAGRVQRCGMSQDVQTRNRAAPGGGR